MHQACPPRPCSSRILEGWLPPYEHDSRAAVGRGGRCPVGKANMDEFAMGSSTGIRLSARPATPMTCPACPEARRAAARGGCGGGLAALALGTDTGGSIRQPASLCGVVGAKPTYGLVSRYGLVAFASSLTQIGPFAANVASGAVARRDLGP